MLYLESGRKNVEKWNFQDGFTWKMCHQKSFGSRPYQWCAIFRNHILYLKKYSEKGFRNKQIKHQYSTDNENLQVQKNCCPDCRWKMEMNYNFKYFALVSTKESFQLFMVRKQHMNLILRLNN